ncbi:MAG: hypothetical protein AAF363_07195 [Bacteroidota bacterium]
MTDYLSKEDRKNARQIIEKGYAKAVKSLSNISGKYFKLIDPEITFGLSLTDLPLIENEQKEFILLTTDIIGQFRGRSYLMLSEEESDKIVEACYPDLDHDIQNHEIRESILLELDNILSASVIAEFANFLGVQVYGDVPQIMKTNNAELKEMMKNDFKNDRDHEYIFAISNTRFSLEPEELSLSPQFVWKLTREFLDAVKKFSTEKIVPL